VLCLSSGFDESETGNREHRRSLEPAPEHSPVPSPSSCVSTNLRGETPAFAIYSKRPIELSKQLLMMMMMPFICSYRNKNDPCRENTNFLPCKRKVCLAHTRRPGACGGVVELRPGAAVRPRGEVALIGPDSHSLDAHQLCSF